MHPLLNLLATKPHLLAEHAQAYAQLLAAELPPATSAWRRSALLNGLALFGLFAAMLFAGTAVLLWAGLPADSAQMPWLLVAVPLLPLLGSAVCLGVNHARAQRKAFSALRGQFQADMALLREPGTK